MCVLHNWLSESVHLISSLQVGNNHYNEKGAKGYVSYVTQTKQKFQIDTFCSLVFLSVFHNKKMLNIWMCVRIQIYNWKKKPL